MIIHKILNNNVIVSINDEGVESIAMAVDLHSHARLVM